MEYIYNKIYYSLRIAKPVNYLISFAAVYIIILLFLITNARFNHWFIFPLFVCGVLIGSDVVKWFRNKDSAFDAEGIMGMIGFHFFFLAPLLHVYFDYWMKTVDMPGNWRDWLGGMAIINSFGLVIYKYTKKRMLKKFSSADSLWVLKPNIFKHLLIVSLLLCLALQVWVFIDKGGIFGYIMAFSRNEGAFDGMGWIFMISESFPILFLIYAVFVLKEHSSKTSILSIPCIQKIRAQIRVPILGVVVLLLITLVLKLIFGGLRGSRSNTVWGLFWALGIIDLWLKRIPRKVVMLFVLFFFAFMYVYGFYKNAGADAMKILSESRSRYEYEQTYNRTVESVLLSDFARSDVQAYLLYRLTHRRLNYEYSYGRTYLGALSLMIPKRIWNDRPETKIKEGEMIQGGIGRSRIYGLAGETMLNFGPLFVLFSFLVLGLAVGWTKRFSMKIFDVDARVIFIPFLINLCFIILGSDSDNVVFFLIKQGFLPFALVWLAARKLKFNKTV